MNRSALLSAALLAAGCSKSDPDRVTYPKMNVIVITLDTVRADRLGCYGYARGTTPNLDALAKESVRFPRAFSNSSFTPPSHASILTGRYPSSHGVMWWDCALDEKVDTLAEVLQSAGYRTACFTPLSLASTNNLKQGFTRAIEMKDFYKGKLALGGQFPYEIAPAREIHKLVFPWLQAQKAGEPFFAWIHYYDAHRPFSVFAPERKFCADKTSKLGDSTTDDYQLDPHDREVRHIGKPEAAYLEDRYDSGLFDLDARVGELFAELKKNGQYDKTILCITADHGEAFTEFDQEWFTHDPFLFDPVTHVPLLLHFPDGKFAGAAPESLVQSIDIMPTLLDYLAAKPEHPPAMQGTSLRPAIEEGKSVNDFVAAETRGKTREPTGKDPSGKATFRELSPEEVGMQRTIRWKDARLIVREFDGQIRLYDRKSGAPEGKDEWDPDSPAGRSQAAAMDAFRHRVEQLKPQSNLLELTDEQQQGIENTGYGGKSSSSSPPRPKNP